MRKLNRKGFTLVELLAVIVILAIVVGITLVTVLPTIRQARKEAFDVTAETAADYFSKQYELSIVGQDTDNLPFNEYTSLKSFASDHYTKSGLKSGNYSSAKWYITSSGKACVVLVASPAGDYNNLGDETNADLACSSACSASDCTKD